MLATFQTYIWHSHTSLSHTMNESKFVIYDFEILCWGVYVIELSHMSLLAGFLLFWSDSFCFLYCSRLSFINLERYVLLLSLISRVVMNHLRNVKAWNVSCFSLLGFWLRWHMHYKQHFIFVQFCLTKSVLLHDDVTLYIIASLFHQNN